MGKVKLETRKVLARRLGLCGDLFGRILEGVVVER